jgi:hypothetical protein
MRKSEEISAYFGERKMEEIRKWLIDNEFSVTTGGMYFKLIGSKKEVA